ncbi:MAG: VWA domain-containing protein, partial [Candidatus Omnitrophica bacterium]|nr:VWA domain-containing protein [Candidatus Omnitrophota bacterium]
DLARRTRVLFRLKEVRQRPIDVDLSAASSDRTASIKITAPGLSIREGALDNAPEKALERISKQLDDTSFPDPEPDMDFTSRPRPEDMIKEIRGKERSKRLLPERREVYRGIVSGADIPGVITVEDPASPPPARIPEQGGYIPDFRPARAEREGIFSGKAAGARGAEAETRIGEYEDVAHLLDVRITVYTDPETGERFFRALIGAADGGELSVSPKEIDFLIDTSKSIDEERLDQIKEGVLECVRRLNPGDRFNIMAFKGDQIRFRETSVFVRDRVHNQVRSFLRGLEAAGQTDVENAILELVNEPLPVPASYIILISDGRPTKGAVDSRRIIRQITRANDMRRSIFCFGWGDRMNRYLLDFLSYQNRGWSYFTGNRHDLKTQIADFYERMKDPLLLDVRFFFTGIDAREVYPRFLPDFFRGSPFALYGRMKDEDRFTLQLLGESGGYTKEMIFTADLSRAVKGGPEIARQWAFRKIYYLISRDTIGGVDTRALREQIEYLSDKYNIKTPYDIESVAR